MENFMAEAENTVQLKPPALTETSEAARDAWSAAIVEWSHLRHQQLVALHMLNGDCAECTEDECRIRSGLEVISW